MSNRVQGKNIRGYMKISGSYYQIFCGKTLFFGLDQDERETTSISSGGMREYEPGIGNAVFTVGGVTTTDNTGSRLSVVYLMEQSVRQVLQEWKIEIEDESGQIIYYSFWGMIRNTSFNKTIPGFSQSDLTVRVSGGITFTDVAPPADTNETLYSDWWTMAAGDTNISGASSQHAYSLEAVEVLEVNREGLQHDLITSGTPSGRQCKHDSGVGSIAFDPTIPSMGETVFVLFKVVV